MMLDYLGRSGIIGLHCQIGFQHAAATKRTKQGQKLTLLMPLGN